MMLPNSFMGSSVQSCRHSNVTSLNGRISVPARLTPLTVEAAHKKGGGSTKNGRDSNAQRRGVKVYGGQPVKAGGIIVRQVGTTVHAGAGVSEGKDHTLFATQAGIVVFKKNKYIKKVTVVDFEEYEVPEGCKLQPGSRKSRKLEQYPSRRTTVTAATVLAPLAP